MTVCVCVKPVRERPGVQFLWPPAGGTVPDGGRGPPGRSEGISSNHKNFVGLGARLASSSACFFFYIFFNSAPVRFNHRVVKDREQG